VNKERFSRRNVLLAGLSLSVSSAFAQSGAPTAERVLQDWYRLVLMLVRHTPTYSPPVASRAFAYLGIIVHEACAATDKTAQSLASHLKDLSPLPRDVVATSLPHVMHGALERGATLFFGNTGPTGQRAIKAMSRKRSAELMGSVDDITATASENLGRAIADHVFTWSTSDGGHDVQNLGFPLTYAKATAKHEWVPTNPQTLQQTPLLPSWGENRTFAMPTGAACPLSPPPAYSEEQTSDFYREALEVYEASKALTPEQKVIARFWSDDPMLSPTPPGHWISIALQICEKENSPVQMRARILAQLGIAMADAFIGCWATKYQYDLLRPITYVRRVIDKAWTPLLITPPFPEYPSGHSVQSAAAAVVLSAAFGDAYRFTDETHVRDGLAARTFASFSSAADEAARSRFYGGIHFKSGIVQGLEQGRCIGAHALTLKFMA
jgi:hypothetical protein